MRFAVIADVLGNKEALKAVLEDIHSQGLRLRDVVCLGNLIGYEGDQTFVIEYGKQFGLWLKGEHERDLEHVEYILHGVRSAPIDEEDYADWDNWSKALEKAEQEYNRELMRIPQIERTYTSKLPDECQFGQFYFTANIAESDEKEKLENRKTEAEVRLFFNHSKKGRFVLRNIEVMSEREKFGKGYSEGSGEFTAIFSADLAIKSLSNFTEISLHPILRTFFKNDKDLELIEFESQGVFMESNHGNQVDIPDDLPEEEKLRRELDNFLNVELGEVISCAKAVTDECS